MSTYRHTGLKLKHFYASFTIVIQYNTIHPVIDNLINCKCKAMLGTVVTFEIYDPLRPFSGKNVLYITCIFMSTEFCCLLLVKSGMTPQL